MRISCHPPENLAALVARAESGYDLVSYMAKLKCESLAERALIPAFVFFFFHALPARLDSQPAPQDARARRAAAS